MINVPDAARHLATLPPTKPLKLTLQESHLKPLLTKIDPKIGSQKLLEPHRRRISRQKRALPEFCVPFISKMAVRREALNGRAVFSMPRGRREAHRMTASLDGEKSFLPSSF
ncbi:hypothetical protein AVEN_447-1 [Araneus ventricosus]|uniref:Uncharacterized protein n=1 Tax=Araneus ventricosus TaxID=182803 RepID=A0A4Y2TEC8_ARAVE|nr:hypothetical protein AVEN_3398-1 [Araneus ventricosus]GBN98969.1 hypothetical protein AVEN_162405-1 [Araneus ventricosus]GBO12444.1 hypothetical protein AVEN_227759-1 [Araneus ventricosus]GBO12457.1 hypothetical protein AVEN_447-1 [Araneus ventricosus]